MPLPHPAGDKELEFKIADIRQLVSKGKWGLGEFRVDGLPALWLQASSSEATNCNTLFFESEQ